jgi:hypothetical protein
LQEEKEDLATQYADTVSLSMQIPRHLIKRLALHMQNDLCSLSAPAIDIQADEVLIDPELLAQIGQSISQLYTLLASTDAEDKPAKAAQKKTLKKSQVIKTPAPRKRKTAPISED